jgi:hypothetical protein
MADDPLAALDEAIRTRSRALLAALEHCDAIHARIHAALDANTRDPARPPDLALAEDMLTVHRALQEGVASLAHLKRQRARIAAGG